MKKTYVFAVLVIGVAIGLFYFGSTNNERSLYSNRDNAQAVLQDQEIVQPADQLTPDNVEFIANSNDIDEGLLDWYFSMPDIDPDKIDWDYRDPEFKEYELKFKENPESFVKLAGSTNLDNEWLYMAIEVFLQPSDNNLLLPYLDNNLELVNLAYRKGMHRKYKIEFQSALYNWQGRVEDIPIGLILAAIEDNDNAVFDISYNYAVTGSQRLEVFEALDSSSLGTTEALADQVWEKFDSSDSSVIRFETAFIAAKYGGNYDAIKVLASIFDSSTEVEKPYFKSLLTELTSIFDVRKFPEVAEDLIYKAETKKWRQP